MLGLFLPGRLAKHLTGEAAPCCNFSCLLIALLSNPKEQSQEREAIACCLDKVCCIPHSVDLRAGMHEDDEEEIGEGLLAVLGLLSQLGEGYGLLCKFRCKVSYFPAKSSWPYKE